MASSSKDVSETGDRSTRDTPDPQEAKPGKTNGNAGVPAMTVQRLPVYLRVLIQMQSQRVEVANSVQIAEAAGSNAAQVRKDLSYLGEYGVRGIGYDVGKLIVHLSGWLGLRTARKVAVIGYGRLGSALCSYGGFQDRGFSIVAVLDSDPDKVGTSVAGDVVIEPFAQATDVLRREGAEIAILTVPAVAAQDAADKVVGAGVKAILNFAPIGLNVPDGVVVRQADVAAELQILSYHLSSEAGR